LQLKQQHESIKEICSAKIGTGSMNTAILNNLIEERLTKLFSMEYFYFIIL